MSAYMCDEKMFEMIGAFVDYHTFAKRPEDRGLWFYKKNQDYAKTRISGQRVADILIRENRRSINFRYNERETVPKVRVVNIAPSDLPSPASLGKYLRELGYQSCERPDFKSSDAFKVIGLLNELALEVQGKIENAPGFPGGWE